MRVEDLRYFEHLAEVLNYTRASKDLEISQPTLSLAIKRLEEEWGVQLFSRNRSTVELTDIGRDISDCVTGALRSLDRARVLAEESLGTENATINLGTIYAMQGKFWSQALFEFREKSHSIRISRLRRPIRANCFADCAPGQLDVAFASRIEDTPDLRYNLCWSQPLVLGVNKKHPLAKKKEVSLAELKRQEILSYDPASPVYQEIVDLIEGYDLNVQFSYDDEITLSSLVAGNESKTALFCYSLMINAFDDVVCIPVREAPIDFHKTYVVSRDEGRQPKVVQEFIDFMSAHRFPRLLS